MRMSRLLVGAAAAVLLVAYAATPAGAVWDPGLGGPKATGPNTDLALTSTGAGQGVTGFIDPADSVSDPSVPYPTTNPMAAVHAERRELRRDHQRHTDRWQPPT